MLTSDSSTTQSDMKKADLLAMRSRYEPPAHQLIAMSKQHSGIIADPEELEALTGLQCRSLAAFANRSFTSSNIMQKDLNH
jgi:hypothetical protein